MDMIICYYYFFDLNTIIVHTKIIITNTHLNIQFITQKIICFTFPTFKISKLHSQHAILLDIFTLFWCTKDNILYSFSPFKKKYIYIYIFNSLIFFPPLLGHINYCNSPTANCNAGQDARLHNI